MKFDKTFSDFNFFSIESYRAIVANSNWNIEVQ